MKHETLAIIRQSSIYIIALPHSEVLYSKDSKDRSQCS